MNSSGFLESLYLSISLGLNLSDHETYQSEGARAKRCLVLMMNMVELVVVDKVTVTISAACWPR
jgi:hypothetical protein